MLASYPGSSPAEKREESLEDIIMCPVTYCVWFCVILVIELMPTQSVLRCCWSSGSVDVAETTDGQWKAISLLSS